MTPIVPKVPPTRNVDTRTLAELRSEQRALLEHLNSLFQRERDHDLSVGPAIDSANRRLDEVQEEIEMRRNAEWDILDKLMKAARG